MNRSAGRRLQNSTSEKSSHCGKKKELPMGLLSALMNRVAYIHSQKKMYFGVGFPHPAIVCLLFPSGECPCIVSHGKTSRTSGQVAQLVEQWTENPCVGGSIPSLTTA